MTFSRVAILLVFLLAGGISTIATAAEREEVCVKYEESFGWSKGYTVEGIVISGADLNAKVGSIARFKPFNTYVVIFWQENQATILELPGFSMGYVPILESQVQDQEGRQWKIKKGHGFCF